MRFFLFERCILGIETADPNARRLTKLELSEIFNDFAISREPFDEIDSNARRFPKLEPNQSSSSNIVVFKLNNQFNIS